MPITKPRGFATLAALALTASPALADANQAGNASVIVTQPSSDTTIKCVNVPQVIVAGVQTQAPFTFAMQTVGTSKDFTSVLFATGTQFSTSHELKDAATGLTTDITYKGINDPAKGWLLTYTNDAAANGANRATVLQSAQNSYRTALAALTKTCQVGEAAFAAPLSAQPAAAVAPAEKKHGLMGLIQQAGQEAGKTIKQFGEKPKTAKAADGTQFTEVSIGATTAQQYLRNITDVPSTPLIAPAVPAASATVVKPARHLRK
jgi:hypothetical protein